jgi:hypothetical protein
MSIAADTYEHDVTPDDVRAVFEREDESSEAPDDTADGDAILETAIDAAVSFAGPRIYDRVTPATFETVVEYLAADYIYADSGVSGGKKRVESGPEKITYFESGENGSKFADSANKWDTSNRLFTRTVDGFVI